MAVACEDAVNSHNKCDDEAAVRVNVWDKKDKINHLEKRKADSNKNNGIQGG